MANLSDSEIQAALARIETCLGEERPRDAVIDLQKILAAVPDHPMALCGVGRVSIQLGDNSAALQALDLALAAAPDLAEARNARGVALQNQGRLDEAEAEFRKVAASLPGHPGVLVNLAAVLAAKGDIGAAEPLFRQVLDLSPDDSTAAYNLGLLLLLKGELDQGWEGFEFRDRASNVALAKSRSSRPRWQGEPAPEKTLLISAEQGLGDNIQFARFVEPAAARVGKAILELPVPLTRLFAGLPGAAEIVGREDELPEHDVYVPIMSLPKVLGPDVGIPWNGSYVSADPASIGRWRERIDQRASGPLHVGVLWAGNPAHKRDRERSMPLSELAPILTVPGVSLHSLQVGPAADQLPASAFAGAMKPLFRRIYPFPEVAAALGALDLVIGVDTSLVHLAGAMGRPVWTMVTHVPDWRWMLQRSDSPWYPTMRLFRQPAAGDWRSVAQDVARALSEMKTD